MCCAEIEDTFLESFETSISLADRRRIEDHLTICRDCAQFIALQTELDRRLQEALPLSVLSFDVSAMLCQRIIHDRGDEVPTWLPDLAYVVGATLAVSLCTVLLPNPSLMVVLIGTFIALAAYALELIFLNMFEGYTGC